MIRELVPAPLPVAACGRFIDLPYVLFLDSAADPQRLGRYSFLSGDPALLIRAKGPRAERIDCRLGTRTPVESAADEIRRLLTRFASPQADGIPPFQGGAAGYFGYEWGRTIERLPSPRYDDLAIPDLMIGFYDWVIAWDHQVGRAWLVSTGLPEEGPASAERAAARASFVLERLEAPTPPASRHLSPPTEQQRDEFQRATRAPAYPVLEVGGAGDIGLHSSFTHRGYLDAVTRVREYIVAGDIFQANLSQRLEAPLSEPAWMLYQRLRALNPAPFAAYLGFGDITIISASPERFLRLEQGGHVETRPIKGTRPRGLHPAHDAALGRALLDSAKDRAENLMIVDLLRNDLSRVCRPGTVRVPELFALEHYSTVHHLVSTVVGELRAGCDALDLLRATFPGGSITGAPKVRAMEIIAELEPSQRGVYCGAIGYLGTSGALDTSIVIRTYLALADRVYFSVGGGIVADSDPEQEYRETLDKARALIAALEARSERP